MSKLNTTQALEKMRELEGEDVAILVELPRAQSSRGHQVAMKLGLIAGNGRFPFLLLDAARAQGLTVVVAAIREETDPEINHRAPRMTGITRQLAFARRVVAAHRGLPQRRRRRPP